MRVFRLVVVVLSCRGFSPTYAELMDGVGLRLGLRFAVSLCGLSEWFGPGVSATSWLSTGWFVFSHRCSCEAAS